MYTAKHAMLIRDKYPDTNVTVFYIDVRTPGKNFDEFYRRAVEDYGVNYVKGQVGKVIPQPDGTLMVQASDLLENKQILKGLDIGADDYITKPFGVMELISRVKALLRRSMNTEEEKFLSAGDIFLDGEKHMVYVNDEPCELTFKEYELLKLLIHMGCKKPKSPVLQSSETYPGYIRFHEE